MRCTRVALLALLMVVVMVIAGCTPKPSRQRIGVRVVDGQAEILIGLCDGEALDWLHVRGPDDEADGEEFPVWWKIERADEENPSSVAGQREQIITVGQVPEGFEETVALRGPLPLAEDAFFGSLQMQTGTRASFQFDEQAYEGDGRWWIAESQLLATTEELLAERARVCPETAGQ